MISAAYALLEAVGFGLGVTFTLLGLLLMHLIFIKRVSFSSQILVTQIAILLTTSGLSLLWLILS